MNSARLWIALTRPDNLVNALALAASTRARFAECRLIFEQSSWWQNVRWDEYQGLFTGIHPLPKVRTLRGLRDAPRFLRELRARQAGLAALHIDPADTIVTMAGLTGVGNALASAYPQTPKLLCLTYKKYEDASRRPDFREFRHTTSSWLQYHHLEPRAGLGRTLHLKPWRGGGDGVRLERLEKDIEDVFESVVILSNTGAELPAGAGARCLAAPFPDLEVLINLLPAPDTDAPVARREVVFFGTPFLLVRNLAPEDYAERLNACLDYIRRHYGAICRLVYRPHPAETTEQRMLRLDDFQVEGDQEVAELYFLKNFRAIEAVYSVSSTVSRVAFNYGLDGYALWPCFPFAGAAPTYFETLMGRVPDAFHIHSLDERPRRYAGQLEAGWKNGSFADAFDRALDAARAALPNVAEKAFAQGEESPV